MAQNRERSVAIRRRAPDAFASKPHGSKAKAIDRELASEGNCSSQTCRNLFVIHENLQKLFVSYFALIIRAIPNLDSKWSRCVLFDEILALQIRPELSRNFSLHRGVVFQDLMFS